MTLLSYPEAIQFLYGLQLFGANFGLETTRKLAALAGNPQAKLRFIHVAGTNGKGSTCAMLESIYRAAGLRVGLFTSPHLVSFRERMQVNRQFVSEAELARLVTEVAAGILPAIEPGGAADGGKTADSRLKEYFEAVASSSASPGGKMPPSTAGRMPAPTLFEVVTVMALKFFAEQKCDLVIWETGLGGRLDATNIVTPLASVITNIAFDHTQWLGDTLEKIAAEKAGIIKAGVPVITTARKPEVLGVIERVARENRSPVTRAEIDPAFSREHPAALAGEHQKANAALAVATVRVLQKDIPVTEEQIHAGLAQVSWPGRLQLIERGGQKILLDGAHNVAGAEVLRAALAGGAPVSDRAQSGKMGPFAGAVPGAPLLIIGVLADKDWQVMCEILAPLAGKIYAVPVASARTADARELAAFLKTANPRAETGVFKNVAEALNASKDEPFVVVAGSLYLIGEALEGLGFSPAETGERGLNEWSGRR
ncbi:MAG: bifunctional folylpolyglutamate synthase/dihydrofolate synthase [Verrucomicrobiae bacterium]|nr:bifunctional folylpolyglutamate synthase/dihydrofolate synthase [Verrucomicrobiae bacterium]